MSTPEAPQPPITDASSVTEAAAATPSTEGLDNVRDCSPGAAESFGILVKLAVLGVGAVGLHQGEQYDFSKGSY